jgi:uncharacterized coiled-coil protein SlyX
MDEKRLQALEEKLAFIEMANTQLEDEIFRQQQEIDALTKAHRAILERMEQLQDNAAVQGGSGQLDNLAGGAERPPHY